MKTLFSLLFLFGVAAVLVCGKSSSHQVISLRSQAKSLPNKAYCRLPIYPRFLGGGEFISFDEMESSAYAALMDYMKKQGPNYRLICVVRALAAGYTYTVQYNGNKMVEIYCRWDGISKVISTGYVKDLYRS